MELISKEDAKTGRKGKGTKDNDTKVLTKKSKKEKEELIEKLGLKGKRHIEVKKLLEYLFIVM